MSVTSIVLQSLFLLVCVVATVFKDIFRYKTIWACAKWTPLVTSHQLKWMLDSREVVPQIAALVISAGVFYLLDWKIMMVGYPLMILANYLIPLGIMLYWKRRHTTYVTV